MKPWPGERHLATATFGVLGVVGNVVAVACLRALPHAYKVQSIAPWSAEISAHPDATIASAWAFSIGLAFLALFFFSLPTRGSLVHGARLAGIGALFDALFTLTPIVNQPALLHVSVLYDALFNLCLGIGLCIVGIAMWKDGPRWLSILALVAGVVSVPVVLQATSDAWAQLVLVAGPLWIAFVLACCVRLARSTA